MKPDDFEQQLQRQPLRSPPQEWRREILQAADAAAGSETSACKSSREPWWRAWLWPSPQAWAGLAAAWVLILALNVARPETPAAVANDSSSPSRETIMAMAKQRRELAELLDNSQETPTAVKPAPPRPRSERQTLKTSA